MKKILAAMCLCMVSFSYSQEQFGGVAIQVDSALTRQFRNTTVFRDSLGNVFLKLTVMPQGDLVAFESGSPYENKGAVIFSELTREELEFVIAQIRYFEKRKKVKE